MTFTLFSGAINRKDFNFIKKLFDYIIENDYTVNDLFLSKVGSSMVTMKSKILKIVSSFYFFYSLNICFKKMLFLFILLKEKERNTNPQTNHEENDEKFEKFKNFYNQLSDYYTEWRRSVKVQKTKHPYAEFERGPNDKYFQDIKAKTENLTRKLELKA